MITVKDIRRLIEGLPDDQVVYLQDAAIEEAVTIDGLNPWTVMGPNGVSVLLLEIETDDTQRFTIDWMPGGAEGQTPIVDWSAPL